MLYIFQTCQFSLVEYRESLSIYHEVQSLKTSIDQTDYLDNSFNLYIFLNIKIDMENLILGFSRSVLVNVIRSQIVTGLINH